MGSDDFDHLVLVLGERGAQVGGGCEMPDTPLPLRQSFVGDVAYEVLEEAVLAVLGRAGVGLHTEYLLACEGDEYRLEVGFGALRGRPTHLS